MMDSRIRDAVNARDRRFTTPTRLGLLRRNEGITRRICAACWRIQDDSPQHPATQCIECGGVLHEITL